MTGLVVWEIAWKWISCFVEFKYAEEPLCSGEILWKGMGPFTMPLGLVKTNSRNLAAKMMHNEEKFKKACN
jgi:hypothetical protein